MGHLGTISAIIIAGGILMLLYILSQSQDCVFIIEQVNIVCATTTNISEKAMYIIISVFLIVLGSVLFNKDRHMTG